MTRAAGRGQSRFAFRGSTGGQSVRAVRAANGRWQRTHSLARSRPSDVRAYAAM
jgi:hypothetical protein